MSDSKTLADALRKFGIDPTIQDRPAILPDYRPDQGFVAPEMAISIAKALMLPGHVATGGDYTEGDVTDMAALMALINAKHK